MNFKENLKRMRKAAGLSQGGLAEKSGLSVRTIQAWELGPRTPISPNFFKLVRALGVACEEFADDEPEAKRPANKAKTTRPKAKRK